MAGNKRTEIIQKYTQAIGSVLPSFGFARSTAPTTGSFFGTGAATGAGTATATAAPSFGSSFGSFGSSFGSFGSSVGSLGSSFGLGASLPTLSSGYAIQTLFYFFLYGFVIFLLLILIHYAVYPVFQFIPGSKGIIPISTTSDYIRYWASGQPTTVAPVALDSLDSYPFTSNYTVSIDIYLTDMSPCTGLQRLLFYSTDQPATAQTSAALTTAYAAAEGTSLATKFQSFANPPQLICYIDPNTNDLLVTYFLKAGSTVVQRSCFPIQNIPLYAPFRLTIVYNTNIFSVYLNGVQVSQTPVQGLVGASGKCKFYPNTVAGKCGNLQNLLLWNRPISYTELKGVPVALASTKMFESIDTAPTAQGSQAQTCPT